MPTLVLETLVGLTTLGAVLGSPLSGPIAEAYGRRVATIIGESLSLAGAVGCALSPTVSWLIVCRFLVGLGVGFCTLCKPVYVSETVV